MTSSAMMTDSTREAALRPAGLDPVRCATRRPLGHRSLCLKARARLRVVRRLAALPPIALRQPSSP
jgi:hypothetical protein